MQATVAARRLRQTHAGHHPYSDASQRWVENQPARAACLLDARSGYVWSNTLEGPFQGGWVADDGRAYEETSYRLEVLVAPERLREARELFTRLGKQLGQRAIYFEVREGGEIIDLD